METIKVGDYIRLDNGRIGEITGTPSEGVFFVNGYMMCTDAHFVEKVDKKTAFLTELKELLIKYDADITMGFRVKDRVAGVIFEVDNQQLYYPAKIEEEDPDPSIIYQRLKTNYPITPSNIFDYDK